MLTDRGKRKHTKEQCGIAWRAETLASHHFHWEEDKLNLAMAALKGRRHENIFWKRFCSQQLITYWKYDSCSFLCRFTSASLPNVTLASPSEIFWAETFLFYKCLKFPKNVFYILNLNFPFRNLAKQNGTSDAAPPLSDSKYLMFNTQTSQSGNWCRHGVVSLHSKYSNYDACLRNFPLTAQQTRRVKAPWERATVQTAGCRKCVKTEWNQITACRVTDNQKTFHV